MAERSNAISEITRFWLQARHNCLVYESLPVPVKYAQSDIDLLAVTGNMGRFPLPDGTQVGARLIIETKDEHDWDSKGKEFGMLLKQDIESMADRNFVPMGTKCKFSMLRQEHFEKAADFFGTDDFDRLFVVHAINMEVLDDCRPFLAERRIYFLDIREIVSDLLDWYSSHERPSGLRHTLTGDIWHLLVGFCGCRPRE